MCACAFVLYLWVIDLFDYLLFDDSVWMFGENGQL